jgi:peptidoglycan/xylan/chitin deacetylase (PgdA/CDA1 family)
MKKFITRLVTGIFLSCLMLTPFQSASAASPNLISNASVEQSVNGQPQDWLTDKWGTNNATLTYKNTGQNGSHSLYASMTTHSSGDAKWYFAPVAVSPNTTYTYSDYYKSSTWTDLLARFTDAQGNDTYQWLGGANKSTSWKKLNASVKTPSSAARMTIMHILSGTGNVQTDTFSLTTTAPIAPTVNITSPTNGSAVSQTVTVKANASDSVGVAGVQFKLDGANVGSEVTSAPYQMQWDTTKVADGQHTLTAVVRNTSNATTTSSAVTVTVANKVQNPGSNLIPNPSVETASGTLPASWKTNKSKTNTTTFAYQNTGHTGSRGLNITMSAYTNGDAYWSYPTQPVTGGALYEFSDYYQSSVDTYIYAEVTMQDGSQQWLNVGTAWHSNGWNHFDQQFTVPTGAASIMVYHSMAGVGYLNTDDYKLVKYSPVGFSRGMVSLTFDDSLRSVYLNGLPLLQKYNFLSTQYMLSGFTTDPDYMTPAMMKAFADAGHEIGSHTVTHSSLISLTATQLQQELSQSQTDLTSITGQKPTDFATPHGEYNAESIAAIKQYYRSHRSVDVGFNSKDNFDIYNIKVQNILATTTTEEVAAWISQAQAQNTWLVLVYHGVGDPVIADSAAWSITPANLDAQLAAIKAAGIPVLTVSQALDEIAPQL